MSRPLRILGIASRWIGDGTVYPESATAFSKTGDSPSVSNAVPDGAATVTGTRSGAACSTSGGEAAAGALALARLDFDARVFTTCKVNYVA